LNTEKDIRKGQRYVELPRVMPPVLSDLSLSKTYLSRPAIKWRDFYFVVIPLESQHGSIPINRSPFVSKGERRSRGYALLNDKYHNHTIQGKTILKVIIIFFIYCLIAIHSASGAISKYVIRKTLVLSYHPVMILLCILCIMSCE
jgi:hypothetical protein